MKSRFGLSAWAAWGGIVALVCGQAVAQEAVEEAVEEDTATETPSPATPSGPLEEVVVIGCLINSTQQLINERQDDDVVSDVMGSEMISRFGDTTVAVALRRIPGLSLVNDKFIYVRGLGERYSSTLLNGAAIPSPDLTRNVIPLYIFPTSIVSSLRVQKAYSADMPAAFGGGAVDIRTKGIPSGLTYAIEVGSGYNFENDGDATATPAAPTTDGARTMAPAPCRPASSRRSTGSAATSTCKESSTGFASRATTMRPSRTLAASTANWRCC